ncbi:MAG TPA: NDP-hexose 2,3-dehydratase family protein [Pseudonocardiaceae bacterium]|nr:NDP-hexose 2,3-dehydratase family protein [Pseudonocardiaceae bacterium]
MTRHDIRFAEAPVEIIQRFVRSVRTEDSRCMPLSVFDEWMAARIAASKVHVERIEFRDLQGWSFSRETGNLGHISGKFFSLQGIHVLTDRGAMSQWLQPILVQPEIGILGIIAREFDGVLHFLMQAKMEPGNIGLVQLSPTVQATRSNYTGVHRGQPIRYHEYFTGKRPSRVLVDVLQSELSAWFYHKRNRNTVVEVTDEVQVTDEFCWLTLGQIHQIMRIKNLINMPTRSVLSCIPLGDAGIAIGSAQSGFAGAVARSFVKSRSDPQAMFNLLSWITSVRTRRELIARLVPLTDTEAAGWTRTERSVRHISGRFFEVVAVSVHGAGREVDSWRQPLLSPAGRGLLVFLTKQIGDVLHVLIQARVDAGTLNVAELAPTVQCHPGNYSHLPAEQRPPYLGYVLAADRTRVRYDTMQSEEGGRFYQAENRYMVIEVEPEFSDHNDPPEDFRWVTLNQLNQLLGHSNYLNVEARTLLACMQSVPAGSADAKIPARLG